MRRKQINQIKPVIAVLAAILLLAFGMTLYSSAIVVYAQQDLFPNIILPPKNTSQTNNKITTQQQQKTTTTLSSYFVVLNCIMPNTSKTSFEETIT